MTGLHVDNIGHPRNGHCLKETITNHVHLKFWQCFHLFVLFAWFDSLRPINNLSVIKGQVFLGWTSTKLGLMFLLKDTMQWCQWGSKPQPLGLEPSTLPLHWATVLPMFSLKYEQDTWMMFCHPFKTKIWASKIVIIFYCSV